MGLSSTATQKVNKMSDLVSVWRGVDYDLWCRRHVIMEVSLIGHTLEGNCPFSRKEKISLRELEAGCCKT